MKLVPPTILLLAAGGLLAVSVALGAQGQAPAAKVGGHPTHAVAGRDDRIAYMTYTAS